MAWEVTDLGFRMTLSPQVPAALADNVAGVTTDLLNRQGLRVGNIDHWAIHPGGPRIVSIVAERLELSDHDAAPSRQALHQHGNCYAATVLVVLDELVRKRHPSRGEHVVTMAFGPGLTMCLALLRVCADAKAPMPSQRHRRGQDWGILSAEWVMEKTVWQWLSRSLR